jgi:hypothetical protein
LSYDATLDDAGKLLGIRLIHTTDDGVFRQGAFDNVRLDFQAAAVPEPTAIALWLMVGIGLIRYRRWQNSQG